MYNAPNPFNPATRIVFEIGEPGRVTAVIYDVAGRQIMTLADRRFNLGRQEITWDGSDSQGNAVPSGVDMVKISGKGWTDRGKIVLPK